MARVLLVSPLFPPSTGGIQNLMKNFANNSRHEIHVLTRPRDDGGVDDYEFDITRMNLWSVSGTANFVRFLMSHRSYFDVIYFSRPTRKPFEMFATLVAPVLSHVHGSELQDQHFQLDANFPFNRLRTLYRRMLFQAGLRNVDQFIAVSDWTRDQLVQQGVPESAVTVIHPGVDFHRFATGDCSECDLSPDSNRITLLTVARLDPRKGHDLVLRAIEDLNGVEYFIAGDGRSMEPLQGLAKERGLADRVTFLGYVNDTDLPAVYDCCDAFIMPGTPDTESVEGFGITYLEANAAGKPAIGSDIEGMAAAIKHGETGWLVSPDISEIRDAILDLEEQDISQMKEACQDWAKQHDWDRIVAEIDDKIDKIKE